MYIWRGKNRRDTRHQFALGDKGWVPVTEDHLQKDEDEVLRCEEETKFVNYFRTRIKTLMEEYLQTERGSKEIEYLRKALEKYRRTQERFLLTEEKVMAKQDLLYENVQQLFQQYALEDTPDVIDVKGLERLLQYLNVKMSPKQFQRYCQELKITNNFPTVSFEDFYQHFLKHLEKQEQSKLTKRTLSLLSKLFQTVRSTASHAIETATTSSLDKQKADSLGSRYLRQKQHQRDSKAHRQEVTYEEQANLDEARNKKSINVSYFLQLRLQEIEARKLLIEQAVAQAEEIATQEFRIAHPPSYLCEQCQSVCATAEAFRTHLKDKAYHVAFARQKILQEERFSHVSQLLTQGDLGRHLLAYRMIFSAELGTQASRLEAAHYDPYRPSLADPQQKRRKQLLSGMYVQGYDPAQGVRAIPRQLRLKEQHLAARRMESNSNSLFQVKHPVLQDVIADLMRCEEEFIDMVSIYDHPKSATLLEQYQVPHCFALLRFEWHGLSVTTVYLIAEFTNWQSVEMLCDNDRSRFYYMKELPPGKYRYRFLVDGQQRYDEQSSYIHDATSPCGYSNEVFVSSAPLVHIPKPRTATLSAAVIASPKHHMQKQRSQKLLLGSSSLSQKSQSFKKPTEITLIPKRGRQAVKVSAVHPTDSNDFDDVSVHSQLSDGVEELLGQKESTLKSAPLASHHLTSVSTLSVPLGTINHLTGADKDAIIHRLETIELKNLALCDDGAWAFAINVKPNSYIIHLDLSYNQLSDDGIQALAGALPKLFALKTLKLNGNGFGYDGCRYLAVGLSSSETIQTIELCANRLGDDGLEVLCDQLLRHQDSIQYLYLDGCYIGNDGMDCIRDLLLHNRSLLHLSLMQNKFTHIGMHSFLLGMKYNASLISINFSDNPQIGSLGTKCLGDILFYNNTIQSMILNHINMFSGHNLSGLQSLCYGIKKNQSLLQISLQRNQITEYHVIDLSDALLSNNRILICDLSLNQINNPRWFQRDELIQTHLRPSQPSVAAILYRNFLLISRQGKKIPDLLHHLSPPTHQEQLIQVEEWRSSRKYGFPSKKHQPKLIIPSEKSHRIETLEELKNLKDTTTTVPGGGAERPFSPYRAPQYPFRPPTQPRTASPDYGQKRPVSPQKMIDENGNARLFTDQRKNAILSIAGPASDRVLINAIAEDVQKGYWTTRRVWRRLPVDNCEKAAADQARLAEYERMMTEKSVLKKQTKDYLTAMNLYLDEAPCQEFLVAIAKVFRHYLREFPSIVKNQQQSNGGERETVHFWQRKYHEESLLKSDRSPLEIPLLKNEFILRREAAERELQQSLSNGLLRQVTTTTTAAMNQKDREAAQRLEDLTVATGKSSNSTSHMKPTTATNNNSSNTSSTSLFSWFTSSSSSSVYAMKGKKTTIPFVVKSQFFNIHISFIQAIFRMLSHQNQPLLLHPEKLEVAMNLLALPCQTLEQLQEIVDHTMIPSLERIGFHGLVQYLLLHVDRLATQSPLQRKKLLWDLAFHPPVLEAKTMVMHYLSARAYRVFRDHYRANVLNEPKFCCQFCQERFSTEKELAKHLSKDYYLFSLYRQEEQQQQQSQRQSSPSSKNRDLLKAFFSQGSLSSKKRLKKTSVHKRLLLEQSIVESQRQLLKEVNYYLTGVYFPAYFELLPNHLLPEDYFPQVFDRIGKAGRPMTVLESYRTVRAIDCLGEYLLVSIHGMQGWIRYRQGSRLFLRPIAGFQWDQLLQIQETMTYYRVNDNLPSNIELKVRHRPELSSEIIGYLHPGDVIQCYAVIGDWLQVKYGLEDAAWVLFRDAKEEITDRHGQILSKGSNHPLIRQRKIDYASRPTVVTLTEFDESEDHAFEDSIITYEINGKVYRSDCWKHPEISPVKIYCFDLLRYGSVQYQTNLHHLLLLPYLVQEKIALKEKYHHQVLNDQNPANPFYQTVLKTPFAVSQKELFSVLTEELSDWEVMQFLEDIDLLPEKFRNNNDSLITGGKPNSPPSPSRKKNAGASTRLRGRSSTKTAKATQPVTPEPPPAPAIKPRLQRLPTERFSFAAEAELERQRLEQERLEQERQAHQLRVETNQLTEAEQAALARQAWEDQMNDYFGGSLKQEVYEEAANGDDIFDDLDFMDL